MNGFPLAALWRSRRLSPQRQRRKLRNTSCSSVISVASVVILLGCLSAPMPFAAEPLFLEAAADVGLTFTHINGATGEYYMAEQMGACERGM